MKNVEIKLRAHHGMCLAFFEGKGYSAGFTAHMARILEYLEQENQRRPSVEELAARTGVDEDKPNRYSCCGGGLHLRRLPQPCKRHLRKCRLGAKL